MDNQKIMQTLLHQIEERETIITQDQEKISELLRLLEVHKIKFKEKETYLRNTIRLNKILISVLAFIIMSHVYFIFH